MTDLRAGVPAGVVAPIERLGEEIAFANPWLTVFNDPVRFASGVEGRYLRVASGDPSLEVSGAAVLPVRTVEGQREVGLVRHFRYAHQMWFWEVPRGFADSDDPRREAVRELAEETGAVAEAVTDLGLLHPDNGLLLSSVALYLVEVAEGQELAALDEVTEAVWVPVGEVVAAVADGTLTDGFTVALVARAFLRGLL